MAKTVRTYRIEATGADNIPVEWFDTAETAMKAVNRLRTAKIGELVIEDQAGNVLSDRQLAMIVMEERLSALQAYPPSA